MGPRVPCTGLRKHVVTHNTLGDGPIIVRSYRMRTVDRQCRAGASSSLILAAAERFCVSHLTDAENGLEHAWTD